MRVPPTKPSRSFPLSPLLILIGLAALLAGWTAFQTHTPAGAEALVVYCAHDAVYADEILRQFERDTGIRVLVRYDTEATKSLGFVQQIVQESASPQCDVFWNNELLGTKELQERGLLLAYRGSAWERIPEQYRDVDGHWVGFGARLRVYLVNTDQLPATEEAVEAVLHGDLSHAAIARPLFGTTLTQYSLMWQQDSAALKAWHAESRRRGIKEVSGNAMTKNLVAAGSCVVGYTDTDDAFVARDDGYPVAMLPIRIAGQTICIPNTVSIIRGTKYRTAAEQLVDYLASEETELALAKSKSRQIPLGPIDLEQIPADVRPLVDWATDGADLSGLLPARRACLEWLREESRVK